MMVQFYSYDVAEMCMIVILVLLEEQLVSFLTVLLYCSHQGGSV